LLRGSARASSPARRPVGARALSLPNSTPQPGSGGVRTPSVGLVVGSRPCPICGTRELEGKQTVCSGKCRIERSRRRREDALRARDDEIRALLAAALKKLDEGAP
jgi:predicted nucleic acid-binding Zn ribbon protein